MPIQVVRIDIFISSPGDLNEERKTVKRVIEKLNRGSLRQRYFFVPFLFEDEVPPEIGENAQLIVDRYMKVQSAYILVSMFWTRMGTPFTIVETNERYESGTQYEFLKGYEHFKDKKHPHILLYRKRKDNPGADPKQLQKVESFFSEFIGDPPKMTGLYSVFYESAEFEKKIEEHIVKILEEYPPQPENSNVLEPPEFKEEPRRIDAAIPGVTAVGESTPIQVMICLPDSDGLEKFLPKKAGKDEIKKEDVRAGGVTVAFPVDKETGKVQPTSATIELDAVDFEIDQNSVSVQLFHEIDSGQISFVGIPLRTSRKSFVIAKVRSKALDGSEIECGSVILSTKIQAKKDPKSIQKWNLVSRQLASGSVIIGHLKRSIPKDTSIKKTTGTSGIMRVEGIGPNYAEKLKQAGASSTDKLFEIGMTAKGRKDLAAKSGISERLILEWVNHIDLFRIKGVGKEFADLLEEAGVDTVTELARRNPGNLYIKMKEINELKNIVRRMPSSRQVERWIDRAKKLPRVVSY